MQMHDKATLPLAGHRVGLDAVEKETSFTFAGDRTVTVKS